MHHRAAQPPLHHRAAMLYGMGYPRALFFGCSKARGLGGFVVSSSTFSSHHKTTTYFKPVLNHPAIYPPKPPSNLSPKTTQQFIPQNHRPPTLTHPSTHANIQMSLCLSTQGAFIVVVVALLAPTHDLDLDMTSTLAPLLPEPIEEKLLREVALGFFSEDVLAETHQVNESFLRSFIATPRAKATIAKYKREQLETGERVQLIARQLLSELMMDIASIVTDSMADNSDKIKAADALAKWAGLSNEASNNNINIVIKNFEDIKAFQDATKFSAAGLKDVTPEDATFTPASIEVQET